MSNDKININAELNKLNYNSFYFNNYADIVKEANQMVNYKGYSLESTLYFIRNKYGNPPELETTEDIYHKDIHYFGRELYEDGEESPISQLETAMSLPVATRGALMPDAHLGYALPIGGVVALENAISPHFIGFDISCMMHISILDVEPSFIEISKTPLTRLLDDVTSFGIGADYTKFHDKKIKDHNVMYDWRWNITDQLSSLKDLAQSQLGSSGGGNHFCNIMIGNSNVNIKELGIKKGEEFVALLSHSGSRGVGHKMATYYSRKAKDYIEDVSKGIPNGYEWLPMDHDLGREYWMVMKLMGEYALANHQLIHKSFSDLSGIPIKSQYYNRHNFAWRDGNEYIHRKGATPADKDLLGIIPASMATPSRIVRGLGNKKSLNSSSHGAGRTMSRTKAIEIFDDKHHEFTVESLGISTKGVSPDESYQAYKDIDDVMYAQEGVLVNELATLSPRIVIMGG